jgi:hypothetical protein
MVLHALSIPTVRTKLDELQTTLSELESVQKTKKAALAALDADQLVSISDVEGELAGRLRAALAVELVIDPRLPSTTLSLGAAVRKLPEDERAPLLQRLIDLAERAEHAQAEVATNWLATWRLNEHVCGMIDILARAGQPQEVESHHGLVFDATA